MATLSPCKSAKKRTKLDSSTLTLAELESRIIAACDYHETLGRPIDATERRAFARLYDEFNTEAIRAECARLDQSRREYYDELYCALRRMLDPDPKRREYDKHDTDEVLARRRKKNGDEILFNRGRISIGLAEPLDYGDLVKLAIRTLSEAQTIMRELRTAGVILVDTNPMIDGLKRCARKPKRSMDEWYVPLFPP